MKSPPLVNFIFGAIAITGILLFIILPTLFVSFGISKRPLVSTKKELNFDNIKRVKQIITANKPRRLYLKQRRTLHLSENDLNLLMSYGISQGLNIDFILTEAQIENGHMRIITTIRLPFHVFSKQYINLTLDFGLKGALLSIEHCRIGAIAIPRIIVQPLLKSAHQILFILPWYEDIWQHSENIQKTVLSRDALTVFYTLNYYTFEAIKETGRSFLLSEKQQQLLVEYYNQLCDLTHQHRYQKDATVRIIRDMIGFAAKKTESGQNPIIQNTTALQVLCLYSIGQRLERLLSKDFKKTIKRPFRTRFTFYNRSDLTKHFLVSAAVTASAGSRFAQHLGIAKEVNDATGGSGFSFSDLAADKAGVRFAEMATRSAPDALNFQKRAEQIKSQEDMMPVISHLPEGIMELEFKKKYVDLDSEAYQMVEAEINRRLNQCRLYQAR